jgi:PilX N-terminal
MQEALEAMKHRHDGGSSQSGFALVLAILALLLLTFLGLTLATTTSTELQIATNYRWSQQARYNAEAGVEAAKALLRGINWAAILPAARAGTWTGAAAPAVAGGAAVPPLTRVDEWGNPSRNFESWECDLRGNGLGYGAVFDDGGAAGPVQYRSTIFGQNLNGAFTLWVRRPTIVAPDGTLQDFAADSDTLVLVSEGIAPFTGGTAGTAFGQTNQAVQVVEAVLSRANFATTGPCGTRAGQSGGGPEGHGFGGCVPIPGSGLTPALGQPGTGPRGGFGDTGAR